MLDIKEDRFRRMRRKHLDGWSFFVHGSSGSKKRSLKSEEAIAWPNYFVDVIGDKQPDSDNIHLSPCFKKIHVYQQMKSELENVHQTDTISTSQFYKLWNENLAHVKIPKVSTIYFVKLCTWTILKVG